MSDETNNPGNATGEPDFSEAEINALLQNAAVSGGAESAAGRGAIQQEDIDALLKAGGLRAESDLPPVDRTAPITGEPREAGAADHASAQSAVPPVKPYAFEPLLTGMPPEVDPQRVSMLGDINLRVKVQLGQTRMLVEDVLKLGEGSVVELDKLAGDPVDILVNDRLIARGEVLVLNDNFCVRVNEVLSNNPHRVTM